MAEPPILSWEGLGLIQGAGWLFGNPETGTIDLHIGPRDRVALIGRNGAGKTTLFRLIADRIEADRGKHTVKPGIKVVLLEQEPSFEGAETLMDYALGGSEAPARHEVDAIAGQLGIDMTRPAKSASGGEKRRASLARASANQVSNRTKGSVCIVISALRQPPCGGEVEKVESVARFRPGDDSSRVSADSNREDNPGFHGPAAITKCGLVGQHQQEAAERVHPSWIESPTRRRSWRWPRAT